MSSKDAKSGSGRSAIAIEIGGDWLKMAVVEPSRHGLAIPKVHLEPFESLGPAVSESISQAVKQLKIPHLPVICSLPRQMVTIRILELPSVDLEEVSDMVDLQVGKQTPYSKDEIVSDYRILGAARAGYTRVMLAIVQRDVLRERFYLLEEAGLDVERMSVSTEGLLNWYHAAAQRIGPADTLLILDMDSFYSDFVVISNRDLCFTRSILVGANQLLDDYIHWRERLMREAKRSLETFSSEMPDLVVERIVLTGAAHRVAGLADDLRERFNIETVALDPLDEVKRLPGAAALSDSRFDPVSMTSIVGIGLNPDGLEFNLMPDSVRLKKELAFKAKGLTLLAMLSMAILVSVSSIATLRLFSRKTYRDMLRAEYTQNEPTVNEVMKMKSLVGVVRRRQDLTYSALALLSEIHRNVPKDVFFESIEIDTSTPEAERHKVVLKGVAETRKSIRVFVDGMEQSGLFADVKDSGTQMDRNRRLRFQVVCSLEEAE